MTDEEFEDLTEDTTWEQNPHNASIMVQQATDGTWGVWVTFRGVVKGSGNFDTRDRAFAAGVQTYDRLYVTGE